MTILLPKETNIEIRPLEYRDLDTIEKIYLDAGVHNNSLNSHCHSVRELGEELSQVRRWYAPMKILSLFPNPYQHAFNVRIAELRGEIKGLIQVSPFNRASSTWRIERVVASPSIKGGENAISNLDIGSCLLRHCFETIWEARTWLLETDIHDKTALALYRHNGFQPLAQVTYWAIAPNMLHSLAQKDPKLPNLLPISNAEAQLLYQLDTVAMPPLLRQVYDRNVRDFQIDPLTLMFSKLSRWWQKKEMARGYVFEPQRKAAIGYYHIHLCRDGDRPHQANLTVHPAYTWLYPELLVQMAKLVQKYPPKPLQLASTDYQPEREEYLERLEAQRVQHTLLMSRSVWHKLRETKPAALESLQFADMLTSLPPTRKPIPSRIAWKLFVPLKTQLKRQHAPSPSGLKQESVAKNESPEHEVSGE